MSPKINSPSPATSRMQLAFCILVIPSFLVLTEFNCYAHAKLRGLNCSTTDTYAIGSTFESNLNNLLFSLNENAIINSAFSNNSFGNIPNEVYGLLMCFVDSPLDDCISCLQKATSNTKQPCSNSTTASVWYDQCTLSYSKNDSLSVEDSYVYYVSNKNGSLDQETQISLKKVLIDLSVTVPNTPEMFSKEVVSGTKLAALMQCTRDLSPQECSTCLQHLNFLWNLTAVGMRLWTKNCYMRYESYVLNVSSFPKSLVPLPPAPAPPPPSPPPPALPLPTLISPSGGSKSNSTAKIAVFIVVGLVVTSLAVFGFCFWRRKHSLHKQSNDDDTINVNDVETELEYILNPKAEYQVFDFNTLKVATDNFSDVNKLGRGGFGPVYKGTLPDRSEIAVKRLSGSSVQGVTEFKNEVDLIAKLKHKNLVELLGCCTTKREKLLCYEYLPNGSLDKILFEKDSAERVSLISWERRYKIIEGITSGLHYLHEGSRLKIIHRDLKVSNILLDKDMNPKISDFGLARFFDQDQTHKEASRIAGTQ